MMSLPMRTMSRLNWPRIKKRKYAHQLMTDAAFTGDAGLLLMEEITAPLIKRYGLTAVTIEETGYYWLQLAPADKNYWLTVILTHEGDIVQYYFDITDKNVILDDGDSYFYDLYLDVVLLPDGNMVLLDEDEMEAALRNGIISRLQYDEAYQTARTLISELPKRRHALQAYCMQAFALLKAELESV